MSKSREDYLKVHPELEPGVRTAILQGGAVVGMTQEEVTLSCGAPKVKTRIDEGGKPLEKWSYKKFTVTFGPDGKVIGVK